MTDEVRAILAKLPRPQLNALASLAVEHPDSTWHLAECGCCLCVHPHGDSSKGWIIGPDGDAEYRDAHGE